jgi:CBS domain-containing protein
MYDYFTFLPKVLAQVTINDWLQYWGQSMHFTTSCFVDQSVLEQSLLQALNNMKTNDVSVLVFSTKDRTQVLAELVFGDILRFMATNYFGDLTPFKKKVLNEEEPNLIKGDENDSLLDILVTMRDQRVSMLPIERQVEVYDKRENQ